MQIERETVVEIALSGGAAAVFLAVVFYVSQQYTTNGTIEPEGGLALVAAIGFFVVLIGVVGFYLYWTRER